MVGILGILYRQWVMEREDVTELERVKVYQSIFSVLTQPKYTSLHIRYSSDRQQGEAASQ